MTKQIDPAVTKKAAKALMAFAKKAVKAGLQVSHYLITPSPEDFYAKTIPAKQAQVYVTTGGPTGKQVHVWLSSRRSKWDSYPIVPGTDAIVSNVMKQYGWEPTDSAIRALVMLPAGDELPK